jgi:predicted phage tail protein
LYTGTAIGAETRARFNGIFDTLGTGEDAIMALLKVGRASLLKTNEYKIVIETVVAEASFTGLFTAGNIVADTFQQQWISKADKPHAITVEYLDEADEYARKSYTYRGPEYDTTTEPLRIDRDFLLGCTNADEAKRYAILRYQLRTMVSASCSFEAGIDAVNCEPGDCIWVQPLRSRKTWGGRVVSSTNNTITLDQSLVLDAATYDGYASIWVRHINGNIERRTIDAGFDAAATPTWTVTVNWTANPAAGEVYGIGRYIANLNTIDIWRWRVIGMSRSGENRIRIDCVEYNPKVYYHADYGAGATII